MSKVLSMKQYIHSRDHVQMGMSGGMGECTLCKQGMGAVPENTPILSNQEIKKYIMIGIISTIVGGIVSEIVVKRLIFGKGKNG